MTYTFDEQTYVKYFKNSTDKKLYLIRAAKSFHSVTNMWQVILILLASSTTALPQFEAYWESQESYLFNEDEQHNPWYIDLGKAVVTVVTWMNAI